jgi:hypothetical protein
MALRLDSWRCNCPSSILSGEIASKLPSLTELTDETVSAAPFEGSTFGPADRRWGTPAWEPWRE